MGEDRQKTGEGEAYRPGRIVDEADTEGHGRNLKGLTDEQKDEAPGSREGIRPGRVTSDDDSEGDARRS